MSGRTGSRPPTSRTSHSSSWLPMCARSQTSGDISGECWRTRSASSTASVSAALRARAAASSPATRVRSRVRGRLVDGGHRVSSGLAVGVGGSTGGRPGRRPGSARAAPAARSWRSGPRSPSRARRAPGAGRRPGSNTVAGRAGQHAVGQAVPGGRDPPALGRLARLAGHVGDVRVGRAGRPARPAAAPTAAPAGRRRSAPPGGRAGGPAGTAWTRGSRGRRRWAAPGSAPSIQSAKVIRSGTCQPSPSRTHSTGLSSTRRAQAGRRVGAGGVGRRRRARSGPGRRASSRPSGRTSSPVRRPCSRGELANAASSTGPNACTAAQRRAMSAPSPGVDADLHGGRGAHRAAAVGPDPVEDLLHGPVAGHVQDPGRGAVRVGGAGLGLQAGGGQHPVQHVGVGAGGPQQRAQVGKRWAGQLDLAAGLDGDGGAGRAAEGRGKRGRAWSGVWSPSAAAQHARRRAGRAGRTGVRAAIRAPPRAAAAARA